MTTVYKEKLKITNREDRL